MSTIKLREYNPDKPGYGSRLTSQEWETWRPLLTQLHQQGLPRYEIIRVAADQHGFEGTYSALNTRFKAWGLTKPAIREPSDEDAPFPVESPNVSNEFQAQLERNAVVMIERQSGQSQIESDIVETTANLKMNQVPEEVHHRLTVENAPKTRWSSVGPEADSILSTSPSRTRLPDMNQTQSPNRRSGNMSRYPSAETEAAMHERDKALAEDLLKQERFLPKSTRASGRKALASHGPFSDEIENWELPSLNITPLPPPLAQAKSQSTSAHKDGLVESGAMLRHNLTMSHLNKIMGNKNVHGNAPAAILDESANAARDSYTSKHIEYHKQHRSQIQQVESKADLTRLMAQEVPPHATMLAPGLQHEHLKRTRSEVSSPWSSTLSLASSARSFFQLAKRLRYNASTQSILSLVSLDSVASSHRSQNFSVVTGFGGDLVPIAESDVEPDEEDFDIIYKSRSGDFSELPITILWADELSVYLGHEVTGKGLEGLDGWHLLSFTERRYIQAKLRKYLSVFDESPGGPPNPPMYVRLLTKSQTDLVLRQHPRKEYVCLNLSHRIGRTFIMVSFNQAARWLGRPVWILEDDIHSDMGKCFYVPLDSGTLLH